MIMIKDFPYSCAMRGRWNGKWIQQLELNSNRYVNCITGVEKDSLIIEVQNAKIQRDNASS